FQFGKAATFDMEQSLQEVITLNDVGGERLFVILGNGEKAEVLDFDGVNKPTLAQTIVSTNELLTCALSLRTGFIAFSHPANGKFSTRYVAYDAAAAGYTFKAFGGLASLADNDNITIPDIRERIVANSTIKEQSQMKAYTNTIP